MVKDVNIIWIGYSFNNVPIRLTKERWEHILKEHPEMKDQYERVLETLDNPDLIQIDDVTGGLLALRFYSLIPESRKFVVVVYLEVSNSDGFITTAYLRKQPSSNKRIIWTQE
ncbi:hypothetical protein PN499_22440 [Kamptonema animale CS-326]|uniref:hypothetical protein n=1 Tax=Kamptonema animale TaxID=92934 RepID=UPI00232C3254|nr:hypothetical protein [Kamptonema animale]MDB9513963.1 hypothetical protein [Kamptonema animale CS-326]